MRAAGRRLGGARAERGMPWNRAGRALVLGAAPVWCGRNQHSAQARQLAHPPEHGNRLHQVDVIVAIAAGGGGRRWRHGTSVARQLSLPAALSALAAGEARRVWLVRAAAQPACRPATYGQPTQQRARPPRHHALMLSQLGGGSRQRLRRSAVPRQPGAPGPCTCGPPPPPPTHNTHARACASPRALPKGVHVPGSPSSPAWISGSIDASSEACGLPHACTATAAAAAAAAAAAQRRQQQQQQQRRQQQQQQGSSATARQRGQCVCYSHPTLGGLW